MVDIGNMRLVRCSHFVLQENTHRYRMMSTPSRSCSIMPGSFNSVLSIDDDQSHQEIVLGTAYNADATPSPLEYHIVVARMASVFQPYKNRGAKITVENIRNSLQSLDRSLPAYLMSSEQLSISQDAISSQAKLQRSLMLLMLNACSINLCLSALPIILDLGDDRDDFLSRGRAAASNLIEQRRIENCTYFRKAWGPRMAILSAGIYLMLDLICFRRTKSAIEVQETHGKVAFVLQILESESGSWREVTNILHRLIRIFHALPEERVIAKSNLFHIMNLAAIPAKETDENLIRTFATPPERSNRDPSHALGSQELMASENDMFGEYDLLNLDSHFSMEFSGIGFDLFQQVPDDSLDWSIDIMSTVLPESHSSGNYLH